MTDSNAHERTKYLLEHPAELEAFLVEHPAELEAFLAELEHSRPKVLTQKHHAVKHQRVKINISKNSGRKGKSTSTLATSLSGSAAFGLVAAAVVPMIPMVSLSAAVVGGLAGWLAAYVKERKKLL